MRFLCFGPREETSCVSKKQGRHGFADSGTLNPSRVNHLPHSRGSTQQGLVPDDDVNIMRPLFPSDLSLLILLSASRTL